MEITQACVNIRLFIQKFFRFPIRLCPVTMETRIDKNFSSPKLGTRHIWLCEKITTVLVAMFSVFRIAKIFHHWKEGSTIEEMGFYVLVTCLGGLSFSIYQTMEREASQLSFEQTNILKLAKIRKETRVPISTLKPRARENAVYVVIWVAFLTVTCFSTSIPFLVNYDPVKIILDWQLPEHSKYLEKTYVKLTSSCMYLPATICILPTAIYFMVNIQGEW